MTKGELTAYLSAEIAAFPAKVSLLMTDLKTGEVLQSVNPDARVVSASTIKLPILLAALEGVRLGAFELKQQIPVPRQEILPDTEVFERGIATYSLWELLYWMIVESDNTATNVCIETLGYERINAYAAEVLGLTDTICQRKMLDWPAMAAGRNNFTSPRDQEKIYRALCGENLLTPALTRVALDILCRQRCMDGFLRYIPENVTLAHKTGGLDFLMHDAGAFLLPERPFFLGIFTWDGPSAEGDPAQKRLVGRLAKTILDTVNTQDFTSHLT